jgi:DNA helicase-2/ATP-dependent DNA helicase PcrA
MAPTSWRARQSSPPWRHPSERTASEGGGIPGDEWGPGPAVWHGKSAAAPPSRRHRPEASPSREPGERFVDYDESGDAAEGVELRRGSKVVHERFGRGEVMKVVSIGEPAVVAFFPGWGEKKVLARFLKLG